MARTKIWKDALYSGTWVTTKGQVFDCGPDDLRHFHDRTKAMLANGACIPWTFEHQGDEGAIGLSSNDLLALWAKNTGGHIHDVRLASPSGPLEVLMDVADVDKPKLESIKFVSPDIRNNWRDRHGPAFDKVGPYWPGQSFAHIAITPMPVQYPQQPFEFDKVSRLSLSAAGVDVSLSAAKLQTMTRLSAKDDPMAMDEKDDDLNLDDETTPADPPAPPASPTPPPAPTPASDAVNGDAHRIQSLSEIVKDLGIEVHVTPGMTLASYVDHLHTAFKTHKATKGGADDDNLNEPAPDNTNPSNNPQEPEVAENPPIMMSATNTITPRERLLAKKLVKASNESLRRRIGELYTRGYIDENIKGELEEGIKTIKLSMSDLTDDGDLKPTPVSIQVEAYERQMKTGKPGPFVKPKGPAAPPSTRPNPHKPISSSIALSATEDEEVVEPDDDSPGDNVNTPPNREIINRISGGRYDAYLAQKNSKPQ